VRAARALLFAAAMRSLTYLVLVVVSLCSNAFADPGESGVVGGSTVPRGRWPDIVAVIGRDGMCSGTLVAQDVVLTAGHCIDIRPYEVIVDTIDYAASGGERIAVTWSRAYPKWEQRYDVGVLMLAHRATVAKPRIVTSACTARALVDIGTEVQIAGFGLATAAANDNNTRLREATVPIIDPTCSLDPACNPAISPHGEFMAGGHGADSCFGDSGGPVYLDTKDGHGHALVGVVSRGLALPAAPCGNGGVYVRVDKVISWIQSVTGRTLQKTRCSVQDADDDGSEDTASSGCSSGASVGILAALGLLLCAWLLARHDRRALDPHDIDP
jgi:secreted trypsin-like serine protease